MPKPGANALSAVSAIIDKYDWDVPELHLESGRLDEVFRTLTQRSAARRDRRVEPRSGAARMNKVLVVFRRELRSYFATPLAYVFIVIFLVLAAVFTFQVGGFFERDQADLQPFFRWHPWLYLVLIPAISMRLWAEERNSGSIELLMTLADHPVAGGGRQIPRRLVLRGHCPAADVSGLDHGQLSGLARTTARSSPPTSAAC